MPVFPQVVMVPWGLNEMSVTYLSENTTLLTLSWVFISYNTSPPSFQRLDGVLVSTFV